MNLICNAFAFEENTMGNGTNRATEETKLNYIKNSAVSLISAKINNSSSEVALCTNTSIPEEFQKLFKAYGIKIIPIEFDLFSFGTNMLWSLAFYKLNVIYKLVQQNKYDNIILIDTDTVVINSVDSVWSECISNILIPQYSCRIGCENYSTYKKETISLFGKNIIPKYTWGGGFIAGSIKLLKSFVEECYRYYLLMKQNGLQTSKGDEFLIYCASLNYMSVLKDASPYVYRFWTGIKYYDNRCFPDDLCVWHVPSEKKHGLLYVFKFIVAHNQLPSLKRLRKMLGISIPRRSMNYYTIKFYLKRFGGHKND